MTITISSKSNSYCWTKGTDSAKGRLEGRLERQSSYLKHLFFLKCFQNFSLKETLTKVRVTIVENNVGNILQQIVYYQKCLQFPKLIHKRLSLLIIQFLKLHFKNLTQNSCLQTTEGIAVNRMAHPSKIGFLSGKTCFNAFPKL